MSIADFSENTFDQQVITGENIERFLKDIGDEMTIEEKNSFKDFDEFYNHWLEQKSIYGMKCPATGVEMTTKRFFNKPGERKNKCMTNISVDRILSSRNYSPKNLIFTTWEYNCVKSNLSPKDAKTFLRIVKERYGTDDLE